ncbi:DUF247 domain protein [Medicago truncatula]|uniref:DUF247 domain protein n=1 Tax=Medicago truncatula TaxID=3880 RepID=A0A072VIN0_MEDTR|nr:DUF247 domain protein [Medicago truncatula]
MTANTTLEQRFIDLQNANLTLPKYLAIPKIQKVASDLRNRKDFEKHYSPKLVSMGPIHHGRPNLECNPKDLYQDIADNINELKGLFADDVLTSVSCEGFDNLEEKLSWMLFVDGCSLLRILDIFVIEPENIMFDKLYLVFGDVLLLENQLPFELLKLFQVIEPALIRNMIYFLQKFCFQYKSKYFYPEDNISMKPIHLLDLLRQILLPRFKRKNQSTLRSLDLLSPSSKPGSLLIHPNDF